MTHKIEYNFNKQTELANCNFAKTVLMLLVVLYHSILFWNGDWFVGVPLREAPGLAVFAQWLNSFHIYAFTLISGYIYAYLRFECKKYDKFIPFVKNKAMRLLIPYAFMAVVWVVPIGAYFFKFGISDVVSRFVFSTSPNQLWFLWMLFDVFIIFWLLSSFFEKHDFWGAIVVIFIYGISLIGGKFIDNYFMIWTACSYVPLFWLGVKIRQRGSHIIRKIPALLWIVADIVVFALCKYVIVGTSLIAKLLNLASTFALHVVGAIMAFAVLQKIAEMVPTWKNRKVFSMFVKTSMPIYLFHQQVIYFLIAGLNGYINPYLHALINFVGALGISLLISVILMKFKWTKFLIGEK